MSLKFSGKVKLEPLNEFCLVKFSSNLPQKIEDYWEKAFQEMSIVYKVIFNIIVIL